MGGKKQAEIKYEPCGCMLSCGFLFCACGGHQQSETEKETPAHIAGYDCLPKNFYSVISKYARS